MTNFNKAECYDLWAKNKYFVLGKSQKIYNEIREYLKVENPDLDILKSMIEKASNLPDDRGMMANALEHIWGYFKKSAEEDEKLIFLHLLKCYRDGEIPKERVLEYLQSLLKKYPNSYLQESKIFDFSKETQMFQI